MSMMFANRSEAGRRLAERLKGYEGHPQALILGLPRGGIPVAFEVSKALGLPLDVFVVRKLGAPGREELAMGAIASGGAQVLNPDVVEWLRITGDTIAGVQAREQRELTRREAIFRAGLPPLELQGKTAILVDDGLATGATMRAAVAAARQMGAARVVAAAPTGSAEACGLVAHDADEVVCLDMPERFSSVGQWYQDFTQVQDADVRTLIVKARHLS